MTGRLAPRAGRRRAHDARVIRDQVQMHGPRHLGARGHRQRGHRRLRLTQRGVGLHVRSGGGGVVEPLVRHADRDGGTERLGEAQRRALLVVVGEDAGERVAHARPTDRHRAAERPRTRPERAGHDGRRRLVRGAVERHTAPFEPGDELERQAAPRNAKDRADTLGGECIGQRDHPRIHGAPPKCATTRSAEKRSTAVTASGL